jgi:hypothetical protein
MFVLIIIKNKILNYYNPEQNIFYTPRIVFLTIILIYYNGVRIRLRARIRKIGLIKE